MLIVSDKQIVKTIYLKTEPKMGVPELYTFTNFMIAASYTATVCLCEYCFGKGAIECSDALIDVTYFSEDNSVLCNIKCRCSTGLQSWILHKKSLIDAGKYSTSLCYNSNSKQEQKSTTWKFS